MVYLFAEKVRVDHREEWFVEQDVHCLVEKVELLLSCVYGHSLNPFFITDFFPLLLCGCEVDFVHLGRVVAFLCRFFGSGEDYFHFGSYFCFGHPVLEYLVAWGDVGGFSVLHFVLFAEVTFSDVCDVSDEFVSFFFWFPELGLLFLPLFCHV